MTDLTKASEARERRLTEKSIELLERIWSLNGRSFPLATRDDLLAIEAAVRSDTLADVAARLPEALAVADSNGHPIPGRAFDAYAAAILAHLTGGTDR